MLCHRVTTHRHDTNTIRTRGARARTPPKSTKQRHTCAQLLAPLRARGGTARARGMRTQRYPAALQTPRSTRAPARERRNPTRAQNTCKTSPPKRHSNAPPVGRQREHDSPPCSGVNPGPSRSETVARHAEKARPPAGRPHRANAAAPESTTATNRDPACRSHLKPGTPPCTSGRARITSARARPLKPSGSCTSPATREAETV